eukprot:3654204-Prymnesium_polylepis.2
MADGPTSFRLSLRPRALPAGQAPAGPLRDRQAEARKALENAKDKVLAECGEQKRTFTAATKGAATTAYTELAASKALAIVPKMPGTAEEAASSRKARLAAAARWQKARKAQAFAAGTAMPEQPVAQPVHTTVSSARAPRRGEYD